MFGTSKDRPTYLNSLQDLVLDPLCEVAGIPRYTFHKLRHFAISNWLANGVPPKTAQHWAGHASLRETLEVYSHLIPNPDEHGLLERVERAVFGNNTRT